MYEHILAAILRADEAKTFALVKPLYCSCSHGSTSILIELKWIADDPSSKIPGVTAEKNWRNYRTDYKIIHCNS
jgi:hypothetical protein